MNSQARIAIVGEAWGVNEERLRRPFVGTSGLELIRMLSEAGLLALSQNDRAMSQHYWASRDSRAIAHIWDAHPEFMLTNVFNVRPHPTDDIANLCGSKSEGLPGRKPLSAGKYVKALYASELERLFLELSTFKGNLVLAVGGTAVWALTGIGGVLRVRGTVTSSVTGHKCIPIIHPAAVLREWSQRYITVLDLMKARREAEFPEIRRPMRAIWIEPSLGDMEYFYDAHIRGSDLLSIDIETNATEITCIGFAPNERVSLVVPFVDHRKPGGSYWNTLHDERKAHDFVRRVLSSPCRKLFQNGLFDIAVIRSVWRIYVTNCAEDTMLLHHALHPEMQKGLGFLGSAYTDEPAWKLMRSKEMETLKRDA